jgi:hypothetical protein
MPPPGHLRLPRTLIPALMLLAAHDGEGHAPPQAAMRHLERLRLARSGRITTAGRAIVTDMTEANLVISVECERADLPYRSTVWASPGSAVWGRPLDGEVFELRRIDPVELPLLLAQVTDVGRRPQPPFSGSVVVPAAPLQAMLGNEHDQESAFGILVAAGVEPAWADRLLIALEHRRSTWSVSSVWTDPDGTHGMYETSALDAGPAGYWHVRRCEQDGTATYTVGSLASMMRALRRCVPTWCCTPV